MQSEETDIKAETRYRKLFENPKEKVITLSHLFDAIDESGLRSNMDEVMGKEDPIRVVIEGSAFPRNIDVVESVLKERNNIGDEVLMIDVSKSSVEQHKAHVERGSSTMRSEVIQGDMNELPLPTNSADILINDCAINFNRTREGNEQTLAEMRRVLKPGQSIALVTVVVDRKYDAPEYGEDQELVPDDKIDKPGKFQSFRTLNDGSIELIRGTERKAWPVKYYERLFDEQGFNATKFDSENGKNTFPEESGISYRRYLLSPNPLSN